MICPACGREGRGQFCPGCGSRLPLTENAGSPPPASGAAIPPSADSGAPVVRATPHFQIHVPPGSFAAQNLPLIASRLEGAYALITSMLGVDLHGAMIDVHLSDIIVEYGGQRLGSAGYAIPRRMQIHDEYVADAPGESLERSLLVLLLALALGNDEEPAPMIVDGLHADIMQRLNPSTAADAAASRLVDAKTRNEMPHLQSLLGGPAPATQEIYYAAATSFVTFLLHTYGVAAFTRFAGQLDAAQPDTAAKSAFGQTLSQIEKTWIKSIRLGKPGGTSRFLKLSMSYMRGYKLKVAEVVIYISMGVAFTIGMAKMQGFLFDKAIGHHDLHALAVIMGILAGGFVVVSLAQRRQSYLIAHISGSILKDMRLKMFTLVQRLQPGFFQTTRTGDIMSRMTSDMAAVQSALTGSLAQGFRMMLTLVAAVITIFVTDWKLALIGVAGTPVFFLTSKYFGPRAARSSKESQRQLANATSTLQENLGAQPVVKAFSLQERMVDEYTRALDSVFRASLRMTFLTGMYSLTVSSIATGINLLVLGMGAWLVIQGNLTPGILVSFLGLMAQVISPVQNLSNILQGFQQASGAMDRIDEFLQVEPTIKDAENAQPIGPIRHAIQLEGVTFGYTDSDTQIRDLSLTIAAGSSVALVGPSGCGKSTTLNLIMRFYDPDEGRVTFDGMDVRGATLESLRGQMGVVFQDNVLFNMSIRENIRLGHLGATDAEVEEACKAAEIHDLIMSLPDEYDTVVGERGGRLSGGQRQRMAIARAILRDPSVLVLDEATSALDPRTEAAINETLSRIGRGRTTISVTHRLSSVVSADRIFVLDRGRVIEQGTHDELLTGGGLYAQLWQEQGGAVGAVGGAPGVAVRQLQNVPMFSHLPPPILAALARRLMVEQHPAGEEIIRVGEPGDKLYIIQRGQVEVIGRDPLGRERPLAMLREGDFFGEMALLRDAPRAAACRARTGVQLLSLSRADFNGLLKSAPQIQDLLEQAAGTRETANAARPA